MTCCRKRKRIEHEHRPPNRMGQGVCFIVLFFEQIKGKRFRFQQLLIGAELREISSLDKMFTDAGQLIYDCRRKNILFRIGSDQGIRLLVDQIQRACQSVQKKVFPII